MKRWKSKLSFPEDKSSRILRETNCWVFCSTVTVCVAAAGNVERILSHTLRGLLGSHIR